MPTASIDFTMATLAIIMVTAGAIYGINIVAAPYLETKSSESRFYQLGRSILLSEGNPENWGTGEIPTAFGLSDGNEVYSLNVDKVTRLNSDNHNAVNYSTIWRSLGVDDVSIGIEVSLLYDLSLSVLSSVDNGDNTTYTIQATCTKDGYPVESDMSYYVTVRSSTLHATGITNSSGIGVVQFTIPDTQSGTAMLVGFSKLQDSIVTYDVLPFAHQSGAPQPPNTYATLSPLNNILYPTITNGSSVNAVVFSYDYSFNLTSSGSEYLIPSLQDAGPMILVLTGVDGADYWSESVAYPSIPFEVGATMDSDYILSDVSTCTYLVDVGGNHYKIKLQFRSPEKYD